MGKRQADGTNTKFLGALLGGSSGCNCGRRRRQAPGEDQPGTRFFGLENLLGGGNNNCCNCPPAYNNNNNGYNSGYNNGYNNGYTNGFGCSDARQSQRFPNNPWSYQACQLQG